MLGRIQFPGKYVQGFRALDELPSFVSLFGKSGLILASASGRRILVSKAFQKDERALPVEPFGGECCERELSRLAAVIAERKTDVLVGMGGGKAIDTAKIAADRAGIPVIIVPTIASTDAPCSGCAILYTDAGVVESVYFQKANPEVVLVDTEIIANAPARFLVAGIGDALSTWFEARSCSSTRSKNCCGGLGTLTGLGMARLCYETIVNHGPAAIASVERHAVTPALEHVVEANILLSGVGFESGGLASAHAIHNGLTALEPTHAYYHGEKVAFGVLAGLMLTDAAAEEVDAVYAFCEKVGLPMTLEDIGLAGYDRDRLMPAAVRACIPTENIHNEAGEITPQKVLDAMLAADEIGERRKETLSR